MRVKRFFILRGKSTDAKAVYMHREHTLLAYDEGVSVMQISMNNPVILKKGTPYTAYFVIEGNPSFKCVDCSSVEVVEGVEWKFLNTDFTTGHYNNRTDVVCGPIANFQFQKIN